MHIRKTGVLSCLISLSGTDLLGLDVHPWLLCYIPSVVSGAVRKAEAWMSAFDFSAVCFGADCPDSEQYLCKIKGFSLRVCVSECSDARQTDLQGWGRSHISSHLQTRRRPETRSAHPADHLAHGQSKKCLLTDGNAPGKLKMMFFVLKRKYFSSSPTGDKVQDYLHKSGVCVSVYHQFFLSYSC